MFVLLISLDLVFKKTNSQKINVGIKQFGCEIFHVFRSGNSST